MDTNDGLRAMIEAASDDIRVEGRTLGKYEIGSEIGKGGMGAVYLAKDTSMGRTVVIKVVCFPSKDPAGRKMMTDRFRREAQAAGRVGSHPNVAQVYSFDEIDGRHLLVMERIDGRTLRDEIMTDLGRPRAIAPRKVVEIAVGILKGLEAVHSAKIVHRDMKPGNVMLTHKGDQVKILDFGLGKASESFGEAVLDMTLTQADTPVGSPMYMSPEQTRSLPVDHRTDIYSVGVMLFQMLTGKAPFRGRDQVEIYDKHRHAPVPPIFAPSGPIPPELDAVVRKAMAKKPEDRYATAAEMRAAIESVSFEAPAKVEAKPRQSRLGATVAVCALAALAVSLVLTIGKVSAPAPAPEAAIKAAKADDAVSKIAAEAKRSDGIDIPPPPPSAATAAQGCESYKAGRTTEAIATLTRALAKSPDDPEGLYCLCGAYVRQPESRAEAQKACKAYRAHPGRDADKTRQVDLWLRRLRQ